MNKNWKPWNHIRQITKDKMKKGCHTVKNVSGSSSRKPSSGSWLSKIPNSPKNCQVKSCTHASEVGAHVRHTKPGTTNKEHIVAMCKQHNHYTNTKNMTLKAGAAMVRALK